MDADDCYDIGMEDLAAAILAHDIFSSPYGESGTRTPMTDPQTLVKFSQGVKMTKVKEKVTQTLAKRFFMKVKEDDPVYALVCCTARVWHTTRRSLISDVWCGCLTTQTNPGMHMLLAWWKAIGEKKYPRVARFARVVLACLATEASVERVFSFAGRTKSDGRARLSEEMLEMFIFVARNRDLLPETADALATHLKETELRTALEQLPDMPG